MTVSPHAAPLVCDTLAEAVQALRGRGLRISTARRLVLEALYATATPVSAPQLARELGLEESSVYRNLESLERQGMVRHVHLGHGPGLYVRAGHDEAEYLFCERCERAVSVSPRELDAVRRQISRQFGHHARFTHFAIVGLCARCAAEAE